MSGLKTIRQALADALQSDPDVSVNCFWHIPDAVNDDRAIVVRPVSKQTSTMARGFVEYRFQLVVMARKGDDEGGQAELDDLVDGVDVALFANRSLNGDTRIASLEWADYGETQVAASEATFWSVVVDVALHTVPDRRTS